jgi:Tfp pilus assembly protein PilF
MCHALLALGDLEWQRGNTNEAMAFWHRALQVQAQLADRRAIVASIERLAWGLVTARQYESAAWLFGATHAQRRLLGIALRPEQKVDHTERLAEAREQLADAFDAAWSAGETSTVEEAVARALELIRGTG